MKATLGGKPVPRYRPIYVRKEAILTFGFAQTGSRAYLSVAGGFDVPQVMESKSTYLRAKIGGVKGRPIDKGDELPIGTIGPHQAAFVGRMERSAKEGDSFVTVPWSIDGSFVFAKGPIRSGRAPIRLVHRGKPAHLCDGTLYHYDAGRPHGISPRRCEAHL